MATFTLGALTGVSAAARPDLLAAPTRDALEELGWGDRVAVVEIDPDLSDTAATRESYALPPTALANCVVVAGKREGVERVAACMVLFTTRADVNNVVKRRLDVRKASFLPMDRAVESSRMEYGGINPIGLPPGWPVLIDSRVVAQAMVVIGSGLRRSKILLPGSLLGQLPTSEVIEGLGIETS